LIALDNSRTPNNRRLLLFLPLSRFFLSSFPFLPSLVVLPPPSYTPFPVISFPSFFPFFPLFLSPSLPFPSSQPLPSTLAPPFHHSSYHFPSYHNPPYPIHTLFLFVSSLIANCLIFHLILLSFHVRSHPKDVEEIMAVLSRKSSGATVVNLIGVCS